MLHIDTKTNPNPNPNLNCIITKADVICRMVLHITTWVIRRSVTKRTLKLTLILTP